MQKTIKALVALSRKADASSAEIEAGLVEAESLLTKVVADRETTEAAYKQALLAEDPKALVAARERLTLAEVEIDRMRFVLDALREKLGPARQAEAEALRRQRYDRAEKVAEAAVKRLLKDYAPAAAIIAEVLAGARAAADLIALVNKNLPEGAAPIAHPEEALVKPALPRLELSRTVVERWTYAASGQIYDENAPGNREVQPIGGDSGQIFSSDTAPFTPIRMLRRKFHELQVHPAEPVQAAPSLLDRVILPGLRADDPSFVPSVAGALGDRQRLTIVEYEPIG